MTTTGLQCPTCGHVHPLAGLAHLDGERFRCAGCSRLLAVPDTVDLPAGRGPSRPGDGGPPTAAQPAPLTGRGRGAPGPPASAAPAPPAPSLPLGSRDARLPVLVRMGVWLVALVVGFAASAALLRVAGLFDVDAVLELFAGSGLGRYQLLVVLLPLWAAFAAGLAHLVLEWGTRRQARKGIAGWRVPGAPPSGQVHPGPRGERRRAG